jgi:quercetin dioxygenase-like cupin family protein
MKHEDERGIIEDLKVGKDWSVTYITFKKGAVRGNHYHKETQQVDLILSGSFLCKNHKASQEVNSHQIVMHDKNEPHAYLALQDSEMVSICFGKRIGENYEEDTFRLEEKDKLL